MTQAAPVGAKPTIIQAQQAMSSAKVDKPVVDKLNQTNTTGETANKTVVNKLNQTNTTGETANKTADFAKTWSESARESISSAYNSTTTTVAGWKNATVNTVSGLGTSAKESVQNLGASIESSVKSGVDSLSYDNLNGFGAQANNRAYDTLTGAWETFTSTKFVTGLRNTADKTAQCIGAQSPPPSSWMPALIFGASAITATKSLKAAANNFNAGNLKKAVVQIFTGTAALTLAGAIAYQSPVGQNAADSIRGLFKKD